MRDFLKSSGRRLGAGWYWPLVLLALPACAFHTNGLPNPNAFDPGQGDLTGLIMCDIPKPNPDGIPNYCANQMDLTSNIGMTLGHAAVALYENDKKNTAFDNSPGALAACGNNLPRRIDFYGPYPDGYPVCLNCTQQVPSKYPTPNAVCVAKCKELISMDQSLGPDQIDMYCEGNAHVSTNFAKYMCFKDGCTPGGSPTPNFSDPRRASEDVDWTDLIGAAPIDTGNSLQRMAGTTGTAITDFNAGGASKELITTGDAWVEFEANDNTLSQALGVHESCDDISMCPDMDASLNVGFGILLNSDKNVYIVEGGAVIGVSQGTYNAHDRFRVKVVDNGDKTATISYWRITGPCMPGTTMCQENMFAQHMGASPKYPLRIDTSFRELNATAAKVTLMRIQQ